MEWNAFGLIGYLFLEILLVIGLFIVAFLIASLILKIVYKNHLSSESNEDPGRKQTLKLIIAVALVLLFGILLSYFLKNC